jgi:hypothetical protein
MRWKLVVMSVLLACLVGMQPVTVVAQTAGEDTSIEQFDSGKFLDYAMCGATIVFASGTGTWVIAAITCSKAITEHWTT